MKEKEFVITEKCVKCGMCYKNCKYNAIIKREYGYKIKQSLCKKCMECLKKCKVGAIVDVNELN